MENDDDARAGAGEGACGRVLKWGLGLPTAEELKPLPHPLIPPGRAGAGLGACGRVLEWEQGLPTAEELTPLSHQLVPPALAAAFRLDDATGNAFLSSAYDCPVFAHDSPTSHLSFRCEDADEEDDEEEDGEAEAEEQGETEDATSGIGGSCQGEARRAGKKARMVWTPELHHRFVEAVAHLGDKGAVPKAIVRIMNVEGLTRENVASHLQKYRIYLKRTSSPAKPEQPPAFPPAYGAHFRPQQPSDIAFSPTDYCAFSSRDSQKLECDKALQALGWKRTKQEF